MEREAKLRRLEAFRRSKPHCSASALGEILADIEQQNTGYQSWPIAIQCVRVETDWQRSWHHMAPLWSTSNCWTKAMLHWLTDSVSLCQHHICSGRITWLEKVVRATIVAEVINARRSLDYCVVLWRSHSWECYGYVNFQAVSWSLLVVHRTWGSGLE